MVAQALAQTCCDLSSVVLPSSLTLRAISSAHSALPPSEFELDHPHRRDAGCLILNVVVDVRIDPSLDDQRIALDMGRNDAAKMVETGAVAFRSGEVARVCGRAGHGQNHERMKHNRGESHWRPSPMANVSPLAFDLVNGS